MPSKTDTSNTAFIFASHDGSRDLWDAVLASLQQYWPDCPYQKYLVCNSSDYSREGLSIIAVGPDRSWSDTLISALQHIPEEYVMLWIDDHFIGKRVNAERIVASIEAFKSSGGNYLRLQSMPKPDARFNSHFGLVRSGSIYRTSTIASVWRKAVLAQLLRPGESAWDFEIDGSVRSDGYEGFYSAWRDCFKINNLLIKGKISRLAQRRIERSLGHPLNLERSLLTHTEESALVLRTLANRALVRLPSRFARRVRSVLHPPQAV